MLFFFKKIDEGIKFAKTIVAMGDEKELSSRGYLALGIGYSLLASEGNIAFIRWTPSSSAGQGHCIVLLGKTIYFRKTFLHPRLHPGERPHWQANATADVGKLAVG